MALEYLPMLGQSNIPDYAAQEAQRQLLALQRKRLQAQIDEEERAAQKEQAFQSDLEGVLTNPRADAYARLILRHPEYAEKTKAAWSMIDGAKQQADLTQMSEIYSAAANGRYDLASASLKRRVEADKAADGTADPQDEAMLAALESGDPTQQKAAMGMIGLHLSAITGPEKFAATLGTLTKNEQGDFTLAPGGIRYDSEGNVIAAAPFAPRVLTVEPGKKIVEYTPRSNGIVAGDGQRRWEDLPGNQGIRRLMGWTPRARDGGDNSDKVVDNKIGVIGKKTGFDPDAQLTPEALPKLFDAIAATENTAGELNNPGGIKDGAWAKAQPGYAGARNGFAVFQSKDAGRQAGLNLLGNFYNRGQRTVRDIIEGAPAEGGGPRVIAEGGDKPVTASETRSVGGQIYVKVNGQWFRKKS
jgi:hypothetical protein